MIKSTAFSLGLALVLVGCGGTDNSANQKPSQVEPTEVRQIKTAAPRTGYALRGVDYSWPGQGDNNLLLAQNNNAKNYYVIFDGSGSMESSTCGGGYSRIETAKRSFREFLNVMPKDNNLGMFVFDKNGKREVSPLAPIDTDTLNVKIAQISAGSTTPLGYSLEQAYQKLTLQGQKQQGYGEYNIIVITDGDASDEPAMKDMIAKLTNESPINLHTIGFCIKGGHVLNQQGVVNYSSAQNAQQLVSSLKAVLAEANSFSMSSFVE